MPTACQLCDQYAKRRQRLQVFKPNKGDLMFLNKYVMACQECTHVCREYVKLHKETGQTGDLKMHHRKCNEHYKSKLMSERELERLKKKNQEKLTNVRLFQAQHLNDYSNLDTIFPKVPSHDPIYKKKNK